MADASRASLPLLGDIPQGCSLQKSSAGQRFTCVRDGDAVHVLDDRCPHQGYPLSQGSVRDGVLTCAWHNWKFAVDTGECSFGGEGVRRFPSEVVDGRVIVDLSVDVEAERARLRESMNRALTQGDESALIRDGLRLGALEARDADGLEGGPLARVGPALSWMVQLGAERVEYGFDHPLASLTDVVTWIEREWIEGPTGLAVGAASFAESHQQLPPRGVPAPSETWAGLCEDLRAERRGAAEARARAGGREGAPDELTSSELLPFVADHLYAYGHGAIYTAKARTLTRAFPDAREAVYGALAVRLGWATAETSLPPWKATRRAYEAVDGLTPGAGVLGSERAELERAVLDSEAEAVRATVDALRRGVAPRELVIACAHAAAVRVSRFDRAWEARLDSDVTVLDVSHCLTFAQAVLELLALMGPREALRMSVQAAAFVGKLHKADRAAPNEPEPAPGDSIDELTLADAIARRDPSLAVLAHRMAAPARLAAYAELAPFAASAVFVRPIFIAHAIKLTEAAYQLEQADHEADHAYLEATLATILPHRAERGPARAAALAALAVDEGRPPKGLY